MFKHKFQNAHQWRIDSESGFLRVTANLAKAGVMEYSRQELEEQGISIPAHITNDRIGVLLPDSALQDSRLLNSVEGSDATVMHEWQDTENSKQRIGSFAGSPSFSNGFLSGDFVIKQKNAIEAIKKGELIELSSAYSAKQFKFENGEYNGVPYQAIQEDLVYNHTAFLPKGYGRAGESVKILNNKGEEMETKSVRLANMGLDVEVPKSQVDALVAIDAKFANMVDKDLLTASETKVTELETQVQIKDEAIAKLEDPARLQNAMDEALKIQETAQKICNSRGIKFENMGFGSECMLNTVKAVRAQNQLSEPDASNAVAIETMFNMYAEEKVTPSKNVKVVNQDDKTKVNMQNGSPSLAELYGEGAK